MKKLYSLFYLTISILGASQTILNQSESTSRTVQDPNVVVLAQGFHATSSVSNPFVAKIGESTETSGNPTNSNAGSNNPSGTTAPQGINFHDTQGTIDVNGGGQLQFTLPIALPPGVKSVAPQINLTYTSGSGNGIAGYGWNLSGITAISRMGRTIEKDGEVKGIQLDYSDYYSFNGQRLILKSGEYGKDGATYVTEKFSNVKIVSKGSIAGRPYQGPAFWEVTFEDGSQAWYGALSSSESTARTPIEYNIVKWKDAQGNYITYNYTLSDNVATIASIQWGGNEILGKPHFNEILFTYEIRELKETSFLKGIKFIQDQLLSKITVKTNESQFKKYKVNYGFSGTNKYQFVQNIQEFNSVGEPANPVHFTHENPETNSWKESRIKDSNNDNLGINGDFDGNGKVDLIKAEGTNLYIYKNVFDSSNPSKIYIGNLPYLASTGFKNATSFTIKNDLNKLLNRQGFVTLERLKGTPSEAYSKQNIIVRGYSINNTNQIVLEFEKIILGEKYDQSGTFGSNPPPPQPIPPSGWSNVVINASTSIRESREFDFDNNSLSELVIKVQDFIVEETYTYYPFQMPEHQMTTSTSYRYIIVPLYEDNFNQNISQISQGSKDLFKDVIYGDFTGDGKISYYSGGNFFGVFERGHNGFYVSQKSVVGGNFEGVLDRAIAGDFNGDGKTDLMIPVADKSSNWNLYLSKGNYAFEKQLKSNLAYFEKEPAISDEGQHNGFPESGCQYHTTTYYTYAADDLDKDGRSEFLATKVVLRNHQWNNHFDQENTNLYADIFTTSNSNSYETVFTKHGPTKQFYFANVVVPFSVTSMYKNGQKAILLGKPDNCGKADCETFIFLEGNTLKDVSQSSRIKSISQGGIITQIEYKELDPVVNPNLYSGANNFEFPFVELDKVSQSYVVSQLRQEIPLNQSTTRTRKQDFRYRGFVSHLQGRGMVGFRQTARSSWYTDDLVNTKIWSGAEIDPLNDGVPIKEWSIKTNTESQIFPTDISENNTQLLSFNSTEYRFDKLLNGNVVNINTVPQSDRAKVVSATVPIKSIFKDFMKDVRSESTIQYDGTYYLPTSTSATINNGFAVTTTNLSYLHNPTGIGKDYYIGRPQSKNEQMQVYGDAKGAKEDYEYENNLLKTKTSWNRNNSGAFVETYQYDGFGNVIQKKTQREQGLISTRDEIVEKAEYESKGRFVIKKTDNLNLDTFITYNAWGQILTQTDPLGNILTNTYDSWGKLLTSKTNLGGTTTSTYAREGNGDIVVTEFSPDGNQTIKYTNKIGQNYKNSTKKFEQGQFVSTTTSFDALGRKIANSEPYSGSSPTQWNTIEYDDYSRPVKATSFTGKIVQSTYNGRTATVTETNANNRFKKQTADPLGNIISSEDLGGIINFTYNAAGENTQANYEGNIVKTSYDAWGNKVRFEDPSNGVYEYEYNGFMGSISKTKSPKGDKKYEYNSKGQLTKQTEKSKNAGETDKSINFAYNSKGLVTGKSGTSLGKSYSSGVTYDSFGRALSSYEDSNGKYFIQKGITYDDKMRVTSYEKQLYSSGMLTKVSIENVYSAWSGELYQVKEKGTGKILWELQQVNEKGQVTLAKLGAVTINNSYDTNGFLQNVNHTSANSGNTILQIGYSFNAIKNELNSRTTGGDFNILESFQYDDNNRLFNWTDPVSGTFVHNQKRNVYDNKGRITQNDQVGTIKFENAQKKYQATGMTLNAAGTNNYNNDLIQSVLYNENNDPIYIDGEVGDVAFQYGLTNMRQRATYGGNFAEDGEGKFTKYYSEDGSYEVIRNNQTGQEKHLIYIGGTPYESNIVYLKDFATSTPKFVYLHKDYLGSVLAITDEAGTKLEQRHFDAWGNLTHLKIGNNGIITDKTQIRNYLASGNLVVDRGYTSHEHFAEIGIIHMNGRLYDPLLRRFLNADEHIQDAFNTQNYNKYGYVLNNPLMYNDPSGELFWFAALAVALKSVFWAGVVAGAIGGAIIGSALYLGQAAITGNFSWGGFAKSFFMGALTGAVAGGLGQVFSSSGFWATVGNGALAGAGSGGVTSLINGTNFLEGVLKGAVIGGAVGAVSYGLGKLFNGKENLQLNADGKFSYDGQQFSSKEELINYIQKNNGDVNTIMKKLKINDIQLASETNLPSNEVTFEKGFMIETTSNNTKSQVLAKTIHSEGYSTIWVSPGLKGVNIDGHYLAKTFLNHEFIHSYHFMKGLTNKLYLERSAWSYNYAYGKFHNLSMIDFKANALRFGFKIPTSYKWSTSGLNKFIKLF